MVRLKNQTVAQVARSSQAGQVPPFDLGTGPVATLPNAIDPAVLSGLCAGMAGAPPIASCDNGFPFQLALTVTSQAPSLNTSRVDAVVTGHWRFDLATPPNAIGFGTGHIKLGQMVRAGLVLDLVAVVLIPIYTYLVGSAVLGIKM